MARYTKDHIQTYRVHILLIICIFPLISVLFCLLNGKVLSCKKCYIEAGTNEGIHD
jgi:hypothetical protein